MLFVQSIIRVIIYQSSEVIPLYHEKSHFTLKKRMHMQMGSCSVIMAAMFYNSFTKNRPQKQQTPLKCINM